MLIERVSAIDSRREAEFPIASLLTATHHQGVSMLNSRNVLGFIVCVMCLAGGACQSQQSSSAPRRRSQEVLATATIKDLMLSVVDPSADVVWLSVTTVVDEKGLVETMPKSDEEWLKVRHGAVTLMEAANLLMIPGRRVARPGEKSETPASSSNQRRWTP